MKKLFFTNNSDVRLGFEIECYVNNAKTQNPVTCRWHHTKIWSDFKREIYNLNQGVTVGYDGSILCNQADDVAELRTKPLPPKDAMTLLQKLFDVVNRYGGTNSSCGFHVNISSANKVNMKNFNPLPFLSSTLWKQILSKFNRRRNEFCLPVIKRKYKTNFHMLSSLMKESKSKYRCVTLCNFGSGTSKSSRIEIRGIGNVDYTKKYENIARYIKRIEKLFKLSCNQSVVYKPIHV